MLLTVRDVAKVLHVSENTVERWAAESDLPTMRIVGQYRFNRIELLEWAAIRQIGIDPEVFRLESHESSELAGLADSLERGGVRRITPTGRPAVLEQIVAGFDLPDACDLGELRQLLLARGPAAWTIVGGGIAVPHPRYPIVLPIDKPILRLCFLDREIRFGDGRQAAVDTLFVLLSPTVSRHLMLVALLGGALAQPQFADVVRRKVSSEAILAEARRLNGNFRRESGDQ